MFRLLLILFLPIISYSQSHSIDDNNLFQTGPFDEFEISQNTYYNSYDTCYVNWQIIKRIMPVEWEISFCFPNCYPIGIISSQHTFLPNQQGYLNCHVYPNQVTGEGEIEMRIITNSNIIDTVKWNFLVTNLTAINNFNHDNSSTSLYDIYDFTGKLVLDLQRGHTYIIKYRNRNMQSRVVHVF